MNKSLDGQSCGAASLIPAITPLLSPCQAGPRAGSCLLKGSQPCLPLPAPAYSLPAPCPFPAHPGFTACLTALVLLSLSAVSGSAGWIAATSIYYLHCFHRNNKI